MFKTNNIHIVIVLLIGVSCLNFSSLCKHNSSLKTASFGFYRNVAEDKTVYPPITKNSLEINELNQEKPIKLTWDFLSNVEYEARFNKEAQLDFMYPIFGKDVKALNGKLCYISGYMIPLNINEGLYALSATPFSSCYFCGKSGPESVVSLKFKNKPKKYKTDDRVTIKGILHLNDVDVNDFIYIFKQAEEY
ncbi:MAG TPA: hypothetical protein VIK74_08490 [Parasegetibacter sp.]|jgi:hypothetical protein